MRSFRNRSRAHRPTKPYCLRCFRPLEDGNTRCRSCGFVSRASLRKAYWNQNPGLMRLEFLAKATVVILTIAAGLYLIIATPQWLGSAPGYTSSAYGRGRGAGWFFALPLFLGVACWNTAAKITRRKPYFRATAFWTGFSLLFAVVLFFLADLWCVIPLVAGLVFPAVGGVAWRWRKGFIEEGASFGRDA